MFEKVLYPKSIVIIGGSENTAKPGGKVLQNIKKQGFEGDLFIVNPKSDKVQGIKSYSRLSDIPITPDLAIIVIPPRFVFDTIKELAQKGTKGVIIMTAGFGEISAEGKEIERDITNMANQNGMTVIGPNCLGVVSTAYAGLFAGPIPPIKKGSVDFVSGSGATAAFIMEQSIPRGLVINSMITVGNSAQIGIEEVLAYWSDSFDKENSAKLKLIYMESIKSPQKFLRHCRELIKKGCSIIALKSGATEIGSKAASSHTGAMVSSDVAVSALLEKAGVIRVNSKMELVDVAGVLYGFHEPKGKNVCIVTHAGGPGVMLADELSRQGFDVPPINEDIQKEILENILPGSSAINPIDFLAPGTHEHLRYILQAVRQDKSIDAICSIFGATGMFDTMPAYQVILEEKEQSKIPIYPVFTGTFTDTINLKRFVDAGGFYFSEEVNLAKAMGTVLRKPKIFDRTESIDINEEGINNIISAYAKSGKKIVEQEDLEKILGYCGIALPPLKICNNLDDTLEMAEEIGFPIVMKVVGLLHKTESGGVILNVDTKEKVEEAYESLIRIEGAKGVMLQKMVSGTEIILGIKKEADFGHLIMVGMGGIFTEVLKDVSFGLSPLTIEEAERMLRSLRSFAIIEGVRGKKGISVYKLAETITKISALAQAVPQIDEMDINPLIGIDEEIYAVDARLILT